jgi:hypothetical protein
MQKKAKKMTQTSEMKAVVKQHKANLKADAKAKRARQARMAGEYYFAPVVLGRNLMKRKRADVLHSLMTSGGLTRKQAILAMREMDAELRAKQTKANVANQQS